MKLNFNFDGKTLLKKWWQIVKENFNTIETDHNNLQTAHNTLADDVSQETQQRKNADNALQQSIANEKGNRQNVDNALQQSIDTETADRKAADKNIADSVKAEESARKSADKELRARIDEINTNSDTTVLFGDKKQHIIKFVAPDKPGFYFDGGQEYYGTSLSVDITLKDAFSIDGKTIKGTFSEYGMSLATNGDTYIVVKYDFINNICTIGASATAVPSAISGNVWTFTLYCINCINLEFKIDSESPTGERYEITSVGVDYVVENEDSTGNSYFITNTYERIRTLKDLKTDNKNSFIDAVNENAELINNGLAEHNLFFDLSKYVSTGNTLITDENGTQYLSYSGQFDGIYLYHNFVCDKFRRQPKTKTAIELIFNVASRHIAGTDCDSGGLNIGETDVLITYADKTTETFGQTYCTVNDTGDKTITVNGIAETYKMSELKYNFSVSKEMASISFRMSSDNFYTDGDTTGNACEQNNLLQSAVCYDDECVVMRGEFLNIVKNISSNINSLDNTIKIINTQLGTMSEALDEVNGVTGESE